MQISKRDQRPGKLWLPSLLLLAQFLTIAPVLLIVLANEQQRRASDEYLKLLDGLERLSFAIAEWENGPQPGAKQDSSATVAEVNRLLRASAPSPQVSESLSRVDSIVARMAKAESDGVRASEIREDGRAARSELLNAQRLVRLELSTTGATIAEQSTYLKALVAGACLLAFGVVFVVRRFRVDAAIQRSLQQELRATNEEVIAALAAARSESDSKNQFLVHVGHLMRTPLNAMVARMGGPFEAETLKNLAGQVVDYARLDSGRLELQCKEFEPATVVTEVLELFMPAANRKHVTLKSSVGKDLPRVVKGDPERLRQVLVNLMSNAVRFTEKGEILLRVEETIAAEERTTLRFELRDSGIGINEAVRNRLFQPFSNFQPINSSGGSMARGNQGNGLGLAISKKLVELMGGKIELVDAPGRGCTFAFTAVFESVHRTTEPMAPAVGSRLSTERKNRRERRAERRHGTNYPTLLRAQSAGIAVIRVLDVSASGLRVSVPFRLIPRTEVEIRIEGTSVVGIVRNCTCVSANEFHVGILIPRETSEDEQERLNHLSLLRIVRVVDDDGDLDEEGLVNQETPGHGLPRRMS
ncbi:MAG: ATP-binding protein [Bryobacteraceae bacterium]|jgi:signal transduction histidine kinase